MSNVTGEGGSNAGEAEVQPAELLNHFFGANNSLASSASADNDILSACTHDERQQQQAPQPNEKRSLVGNPELSADPGAEVVALSPHTLIATATKPFVCEICHRGFQREQNLQLHRRGHNLPWKFRRTASAKIRKRVYVCPEPSCVHHNPARALCDMTGIKKHFCRIMVRRSGSMRGTPSRPACTTLNFNNFTI